MVRAQHVLRLLEKAVCVSNCDVESTSLEAHVDAHLHHPGQKGDSHVLRHIGLPIEVVTSHSIAELVLQHLLVVLVVKLVRLAFNLLVCQFSCQLKTSLRHILRLDWIQRIKGAV